MRHAGSRRKQSRMNGAPRSMKIDNIAIDRITGSVGGTATRDVGLILAAQKAEHYEISTYGGLAQLARTLGNDDVAKILEKTLAEEKEADELLTAIAEDKVNYEATEDVEN